MPYRRKAGRKVSGGKTVLSIESRVGETTRRCQTSNDDNVNDDDNDDDDDDDDDDDVGVPRVRRRIGV